MPKFWKDMAKVPIKDNYKLLIGNSDTGGVNYTDAIDFMNYVKDGFPTNFIINAINDFDLGNESVRIKSKTDTLIFSEKDLDLFVFEPGSNLNIFASNNINLGTEFGKVYYLGNEVATVNQLGTQGNFVVNGYPNNPNGVDIYTNHSSGIKLQAINAQLNIGITDEVSIIGANFSVNSRDILELMSSDYIILETPNNKIHSSGYGIVFNTNKLFNVYSNDFKLTSQGGDISSHSFGIYVNSNNMFTVNSNYGIELNSPSNISINTERSHIFVDIDYGIDFSSIDNIFFNTLKKLHYNGKEIATIDYVNNNYIVNGITTKPVRIILDSGADPFAGYIYFGFDNGYGESNIELNDSGVRVYSDFEATVHSHNKTSILSFNDIYLSTNVGKAYYNNKEIATVDQLSGGSSDDYIVREGWNNYLIDSYSNRFFRFTSKDEDSGGIGSFSKFFLGTDIVLATRAYNNDWPSEFKMTYFGVAVDFANDEYWAPDLNIYNSKRFYYRKPGEQSSSIDDESFEVARKKDLENFVVNGSNLPNDVYIHAGIAAIASIDNFGNSYSGFEAIYSGGNTGSAVMYAIDNEGDFGIALGRVGIVAKFDGTTPTTSKKFYYQRPGDYSQLNEGHEVVTKSDLSALSRNVVVNGMNGELKIATSDNEITMGVGGTSIRFGDGGLMLLDKYREVYPYYVSIDTKDIYLTTNSSTDPTKNGSVFIQTDGMGTGKAYYNGNEIATKYDLENYVVRGNNVPDDLIIRSGIIDIAATDWMNPGYSYSGIMASYGGIWSFVNLYNTLPDGDFQFILDKNGIVADLRSASLDGNQKFYYKKQGDQLPLNELDEVVTKYDLDKTIPAILTDPAFAEIILQMISAQIEIAHNDTLPTMDTSKPTVLEKSALIGAVHLTSSGKSWTAPSDGWLVIQTTAILLNVSSVSANGSVIWSTAGITTAQTISVTKQIKKGNMITSVLTDTITFYPNK